MTKEQEFEKMVDESFKDFERNLKQGKLVLSDVEFQQFQDIDLKEIERMLDEGSVNHIEI